MRAPTFADAFEVLCLQAAGEGRGTVLFGDSFARARKATRPFIVGNKFPSTYLEFPLIGEPFLDVTMLYSDIDAGTRIASDAAVGSEEMLDWFAAAYKSHPDISCGFELDTKHQDLPTAAIHFQPHDHVELVPSFCEAIGEPERADLYLNLAQRMPPTWSLAFFGVFRGRPHFPLRVCGYLPEGECKACAREPERLARVFDSIGFAAYDNPMLERIAQLMAYVTNAADFQFDIYPDGSLGDTFGLDVSLRISRPSVVRESFASGIAAQLMQLLEQWGAADERWHLGGEAAFARAIPVELDDGTIGRYTFTLMPQWVKARWTACEQQPSKLYHLGNAGLLDT